MDDKKKKPASGEGKTGFSNTNTANTNLTRQLLQAKVCSREARGTNERGGLLPAHTQKETVLALLNCGVVTTLTLEEKFNILNPPAVIFALRKIYKIKTKRVYQLDSNGFGHNVAQYTLLGVKPFGNSNINNCKISHSLIKEEA